MGCCRWRGRQDEEGGDEDGMKLSHAFRPLYAPVIEPGLMKILSACSNASNLCV